MVEKANTCERHCNAILVTGFNHIVITNAAACLCDVFHTTLVGTLNVVAEGEEGIRAKAHFRVLGNPCFLLFHCEYFRFGLEELLPSAFAKDILVILGYIHVDSVVTVGTTDTIDERKIHHLRMLTKPPDVGLITRQTGAM